MLWRSSACSSGGNTEKPGSRPERLRTPLWTLKMNSVCFFLRLNVWSMPENRLVEQQCSTPPFFCFQRPPWITPTLTWRGKAPNMRAAIFPARVSWTKQVLWDRSDQEGFIMTFLEKILLGSVMARVEEGEETVRLEEETSRICWFWLKISVWYHQANWKHLCPYVVNPEFSDWWCCWQWKCSKCKGNGLFLLPG